MILLNTLERALEDVVDYEEDVSKLIHNPRGSLWNDVQFQKQLRKKLDRNYEPFVKTMIDLAGLLEELSSKLGLSPTDSHVRSFVLMDSAGNNKLNRWNGMMPQPLSER